MFRSSQFVLSAVIVLGVSAAGRAQPLFSDGFEGYTGGASPLDKNTTGPNAAPNGSGNPWFGPLPPNLRVVGAENASNGTPVTPHSGTQMVRGANSPADFDQDWYNLAYRLNGGNPYTGNVTMRWWFFDPVGSGGATYQDFAALGFYNTAPGNTDYPGTGSLNTGVTQVQRLSLGGASVQGAGFDPTVYQARVVGASDGYSGASGWFNTTTPRTVGWHQGMIVIGPALGDGTNDVNFYIDNLTVPTLTHNSVESFGYNVLELNANFGSDSAYYDDVSFSVNPVPEPSTFGLVAIGLVVAWRRRAAGRTRPS
jgi:hypothetical protein